MRRAPSATDRQDRRAAALVGPASTDAAASREAADASVDARAPARSVDSDPAMVTAVDTAVRRHLAARRARRQAIVTGLSVAGLIGWSIAIPTVLGVALGRWLDARYPDGRSWTLALLVAGLCLGCANAWRWLVREGHVDDV